MQAELHLLQYKFVCYRICPALANKICITPLTFWQKRGTLISRMTWACSSVGRAFGSHPRGQGFKSLQVHHTPCPKHEKQQPSVPEGCCFLYCKESIPALQCLVINSKRLIPTNDLFHPVYLMQIFYLVFFAQMNIIKTCCLGASMELSHANRHAGNRAFRPVKSMIAVWRTIFPVLQK